MNTGFEFLYNLDQNIKEMIEKWSKQEITEDLEHVRDGLNIFKDKRGTISNHELSEPCLLYTSPSPRDNTTSRMPSSA